MGEACGKVKSAYLSQRHQKEGKYSLDQKLCVCLPNEAQGLHGWMPVLTSSNGQTRSLCAPPVYSTPASSASPSWSGLEAVALRLFPLWLGSCQDIVLLACDLFAGATSIHVTMLLLV
jgi:hypothetical protein